MLRLTTDQSYCDYIMCDADPGDCGGTCIDREMWEALRDYEKRDTPMGVKQTGWRIYCPQCGKQQKNSKHFSWYCERCGQSLYRRPKETDHE